MALDQQNQIRIQEAYRDYNTATNPAEKEAAFKNFIQVSVETGIFDEMTDGYRDITKLGPEVSSFLTRRTLDLAKAASDNNIALVNGLLQKDQDFIAQSLGGAMGWVGFAKSMVTLVRLVAPEGSGIGKMLDSFEEKIDSIRDDLRGDLNDAKTVTNISDAQGIVADAVVDATNSAKDAPKLQNEIVQSIAQQSGIFRNGSFAGQSAPASVGKVTLDEFKDVVAQSGLDPQLSQALIQGADMAASVGGDITSLETDGSVNELSMLQRTAAWNGLSNTEKTTVTAGMTRALEM